MSGNFIYRHHVEPRVKLYSPREESFPIPLKYIDVSRTTHTNLEVKQEKRIDDYWNIDGSRNLSDPWTGFTQFTPLEERAPDGYMWSGRLTRKQLTSRQDHLLLELWKSMGKHAKLKEKQKWSEEKLHLENGRKLRGIYFIDPEDTEFKETIKNARKKLETSVAHAMPCKFLKICGSGASNKIKTKLACILEADESTRMRMGNSIPHHHEDHIAGKGENLSEPKGWIKRNTKIGPVLEGITCCLQGNHGVGIRIQCMNKDNSHSWVNTSHGLNNLVTNLNNKDQDDNEQEISEVQLEEYALKLDAKDFASRSKSQSKTTKTRICRLFHKNCSCWGKNLDRY